MITLTTPISIPNVTRWRISPLAGLSIDEDQNVMVAILQFLTGASQLVAAQIAVRVTNGGCDKVIRNSSPTAGQSVSDVAVLTTPIQLPSGFDNAVNAWRLGGATSALRRQALEAHFLTAGIVDSSLTGA